MNATSWQELKRLNLCDHCQQMPTEEGHDPCIANLPGVRFACCGHAGGDSFQGGWSLPYVYMLEDDEDGENTWFGDAALERMRALGGSPPNHPGIPAGVVMSKFVMRRMECG